MSEEAIRGEERTVYFEDARHHAGRDAWRVRDLSRGEDGEGTNRFWQLYRRPLLYVGDLLDWEGVRYRVTARRRWEGRYEKRIDGTTRKWQTECFALREADGGEGRLEMQEDQEGCYLAIPCDPQHLMPLDREYISRETEKTYKFYMPAGKYSARVHAEPDGYPGLSGVVYLEVRSQELLARYLAVLALAVSVTASFFTNWLPDN